MERTEPNGAKAMERKEPNERNERNGTEAINHDAERRTQGARRETEREAQVRSTSNTPERVGRRTQAAEHNPGQNKVAPINPDDEGRSASEKLGRKNTQERQTNSCRKAASLLSNALRSPRPDDAELMTDNLPAGKTTCLEVFSIAFAHSKSSRELPALFTQAIDLP